MSTQPLQFGHLIEGVVEQDPLTDSYNIRTLNADGRSTTVNVQELLAKLVGQEVRLTLVSFENLARLARMVEEGGSQVFGVQPEELSVPFDIRRKS